MAVKIKFHKIITGYVLIGIVGSIVIALACSGFQIWNIRRTIVQADLLFKGNSIDAALGKLLQAELWATRYPSLAIELNMAAIKCHVKRHDMRSAEDAAEKIYQGKYYKPRRHASFAELIQDIPNFILTLAIKNDKLNKFSGYDELVTAVRQSGNYDRLVAISREIISLDPNSFLAQKVKAYIPAEPVAPSQAKNGQTPQSNIATNKVEKAPEEPRDHRKLLERHLALKAWDKVLNDCEIILKDAPDDIVILELRKLAAANGMRWGVVRSPNASTYDISGKFLKTLAPGTLLEISNLIKTTREEFVLCSVAVGNASPAATFLMRGHDLTVQIGELSKVSGEQQKLIRREAELAAGIVTLKAKLASSVVIDSQNPFAADYKSAKQAHEEYWEKVRELQKKRDSVSNSDDKMRYSDELRKLKGEDIRLGLAVDLAKKKYDEAGRNASSTVKSPELDAMESEIASIREKLKSAGK
ncbi:MAG: hypothetical protein PHR77_13910 [Kiritimatiellae bacterium]|nr:hypothetical protein [Kiritimatiellia bacterium]MDD5521352.1 hypothetical protein [Kiritimatiellia bacterium]